MIRAVVGILRRKNRVLIAERPAGKPYSGYWEFPGGKIENNETPAHALKRELLEELGIQILIADHLFEHLHHYPDKTVLLDIWLVRDYRGQPQSKENQNLQWATFTEILTLPLLEGNWQILDKLKKICSE